MHQSQYGKVLRSYLPFNHLRIQDFRIYLWVYFRSNADILLRVEIPEKKYMQCSIRILQRMKPVAFVYQTSEYLQNEYLFQNITICQLLIVGCYISSKQNLQPREGSLSKTRKENRKQHRHRCSFINFGVFYLDQWMVEWMVVLPALNMQIFTTQLSVSKSISTHERKMWCLLRGVVFPLVVCADHGISSHRAVILEIINEPEQIEVIIQLETTSILLRKSSKLKATT